MKRCERKNKIALLALLVMVCLCFSGCSLGKWQIYFDSKCGRHDVFKMGEFSCPEEEAKMYLANYKNLYGNLYDTDLWTKDYDMATMEGSIKDAVLNHLTKVYALDVYAAQKEITLSAAEEEAVKKAAKEYYNTLNKKEKKYTGASKGDIEDMYHNYALAEKVYAQLMDNVDSNVSEDEARVMDAYVLYVTDAKVASQIEKNIKNGASFDRLASSYNEGDSVKATFARGTYAAEVEEVAFRLDDGEVSEKIETEDGYYFFQCINKYNEKLSEENKSTIVKQRQEKAMADVIAAIEKEYYSELNTKCWDKISVSTSAEVTTNTFFTTLDSYISH